MADPYQAAYLIGTLLVVLPVWLFLFVHRSDLRRQILSLSLIGAIAGPISELIYIQDYWHPPTITGTPVGIEDVLFGFGVAGIGAVLYEELFGRRFSRRADRRHHWSWFALPLALLFLVTFRGSLALGVNSIYASVAAFLIVLAAMLTWRPDLWFDSLVSGLLLGGYCLIAYLIFLGLFPEAIHRWWELGNISGILVHGIPAEELMWAFSWGALAGPAYEFFAGKHFARQRVDAYEKKS